MTPKKLQIQIPGSLLFRKTNPKTALIDRFFYQFILTGSWFAYPSGMKAFFIKSPHGFEAENRITAETCNLPLFLPYPRKAAGAQTLFRPVPLGIIQNN